MVDFTFTFRFEMTEQEAFLKMVANKKNKMSSNMGSVPDPPTNLT